MTAELWRRDADVVLYDPALMPAPSAEAFDPEWWRKNGKIDGEALGRGAAWFINEGHGWVLRHYRRGGLIGRVIADEYFWTGLERTRAFREWRLLRDLRAMELPVPRPVAARVRLDGPVYRADLITERIANTQTLATLLTQRALPAAQLHALGAMLSRFAAAGFAHADLNANNVLCRADDAGSGMEFFLIDFDRGRLNAIKPLRERGLKRLKQSLDKLGRGNPDFHFSPGDWQQLVLGYAASA